jgi:hypothetical protein
MSSFLGIYFIKLVTVPKKFDPAPQCGSLSTSPNKSSPNQPIRNQADLAHATSPTPIHIRNHDPVLWIRIWSDPKLFAGSRFGSGKIIPDPEKSFQIRIRTAGSGMNLKKKNFYLVKLQFLHKMHNLKKSIFSKKKVD